MRPSRWDAVLGTLLLLTYFGLVKFHSSSPPQKEETVSSWETEQAQVKEHLKSVMTLNREKLKQQIQKDPALFRQVLWASWGISLGFLFACVGLVRVCLRIFSRLPVAPRLGFPPAPSWGFREIFRLVAWILLLAQGTLLVEWIILRAHSMKPDRHLLSLGNTLLVDTTALLGTVALFSRRRGIGFRVPEPWTLARMWRLLRFGVMSYATFLPLLGILVMMEGTVLEWLRIEPSPQAVFTIFLAEERRPVLTGLLLLATVAGPVAEEFFFRGVLYGWLRRKVGVVLALGVSAFLFSALHADLISFLPILGLGVLFGWLYEQTGSLVTPVAIHILHNGGMLYLASLTKSILALAG